MKVKMRQEYGETGAVTQCVIKGYIKSHYQ